MPLKLFKRRTLDGYIWHYRGTVDGILLRGSTGTAIRKEAARKASKIEASAYQRDSDGPQKNGLTFAVAVKHYLSAHTMNARQSRYLEKLVIHWKYTRVAKITAGAIRQSAIDLHPNDSGATRNRQVITPTQAVINHCAELDLCAPVRVKRFTFERKIKAPVTLEWLDTFCRHAEPVIGALALTMFATGCRISEARRIEWRDIDFKAQAILIRDHKTKRQRVAHMPQRLLVALANLPRDEAPFGRPETSIRRAWDAAIAVAAEAQDGFVRLTCHSCRHGLATALLRKGIDPKTASKLVGMSVQVMMETYAHAIQDATLTDGVFDVTDGGKRKTGMRKD